MRHRNWLMGLAVALAMTAGAWAQSLVMPPSKDLPAAKVTVNLGKDSNGNTTVDLKVANMAQPSRLQPAANDYVVWIKSPGQKAHREGRLKIGSGFNGEIKFTTPLQRFDVLITAEQTPSPNSPGRTVVQGQVARASSL